MHDNKSDFCELLSRISHETAIPEWIIEKDYYITLLLKALANKLPFLVFKGGTSLSKCYRIINRFSEDIDLTTNCKITQGQKYLVKSEIENAAIDLGMQISNSNNIFSKRNYNRYIIRYQSAINNLINAPVSEIIVETVYKTTSFPTSSMPVACIIGEYLTKIHSPIQDQYHLTGFQMQVQNIERTLVDKVFAICDYYLDDKKNRNSRHIYDIYKLLPNVELDNKFRDLVVAVRKDRMKSPVCYSAKAGVNPQDVLRKLVQEKAFESDYKQVTNKLLLEDVSYEEAIRAIIAIMDSGIFLFKLEQERLS